MHSQTGRIILIVLGVALLAIVGLPLLFMSGMMNTMMGSGMTWGMGHRRPGGACKRWAHRERPGTPFIDSDWRS